MKTIAQRIGVSDDDVSELYHVAARHMVHLKSLVAGIGLALSDSEGYGDRLTDIYELLQSFAELGQEAAAPLQELIEALKDAGEIWIERAQQKQASSTRRRKR